MKTIDDIVKEHHFDYAKKVGEWNEWNVYILRMNNPNALIGRPFYLLEKDKVLRFSTPKESEDIFDALFPD